MKVLIVNTSESIGGAAIAANRLTKALLQNGVKAKMLVRDRQTDDAATITFGLKWKMKWHFLWERFVIWCHNGFSRKHLFSIDIANAGEDITALPAFKEADVVHLHWVNQGLLSLRNIEKILHSGKPVVWTLHDMWPCTGICHHAQGCTGFHSTCGQCRYLRFPQENDLSQKVFLAKSRIYPQGTLHLVAVSHWLHQQVKASTLTGSLPSSVIPNTLSLQHFQIRDKQDSRTKLGLPQEKAIILFGAARIDDPIKGFPTLLMAIEELISNGRFRRKDLHLAYFGKIKYPQQILPLIPIDYTDLGWIKDAETLSVIYSAVDTVVCASRYETFGQTLIEAQACGCLPVSFNNSGQTDIIQHRKNGYLAEAYSTKDLAKGMEWALTEGKGEVSAEEMRNEVMHRYSGDVVAQQYIKLYEDLLQQECLQQTT